MTCPAYVHLHAQAPTLQCSHCRTPGAYEYDRNQPIDERANPIRYRFACRCQELWLAACAYAYALGQNHSAPNKESPND